MIKMPLIQKYLPSNRYLLTSLILLTLSLVFFIGIDFLLAQHKTSLEDGLKLRSHLILQALSTESKVDLVLDDTLSLGKRTLRYFKSDEDLAGIAFYHSNRTRIVGNIKTPVPDNFRKYGYQGFDNLLITTAKVYDEGYALIGYVSVSYRTSTFMRMALDLRNKLALMSLVSIIIIAAILFWLIRLIENSTISEAKKAVELEIAQNNTVMQRSFLANMSHDLRTPLSAIIGFSKLLQQNIKKEINITNINHVLDASDSILVLINDILDFSKIESGEIGLEYEHFNLNKAVNSVCHSLTPKVSDQVYFDFKSEIKSHQIVYGDYYRVKQILTNIINNAIKYTQQGSIIVKSECLEEGEGILFQCSVSDTGIGIIEGAQDEVFNAFKRVHHRDEVKKNTIGTGLGLSIVKHLIEVMKGRIWFDSTKGVGTTFYFEIPFQPGIEEKMASVKKNDLKIPVQTKAHVLIAEDYELNQYLLQNTLSNMGISSDVASNGKEAISLLEDNGYDLILMDIQMPVMGGIKATEIIRKSQKDYNKIPIIALTANAIKGDKEYYLASGINGYVSKPIDENILYQEMKKFLSFEV
ncbi:MAG TPA: response regulator [Flavobacteriales bacterium]|nr:response regulator [Flavobacteriales bacterium]